MTTNCSESGVAKLVSRSASAEQVLLLHQRPGFTLSISRDGDGKPSVTQRIGLAATGGTISSQTLQPTRAGRAPQSKARLSARPPGSRAESGLQAMLIRFSRPSLFLVAGLWRGVVLHDHGKVVDTRHRQGVEINHVLSPITAHRQIQITVAVHVAKGHAEYTMG